MCSKTLIVCRLASLPPGSIAYWTSSYNRIDFVPAYSFYTNERALLSKLSSHCLKSVWRNSMCRWLFKFQSLPTACGGLLRFRPGPPSLLQDSPKRRQARHFSLTQFLCISSHQIITQGALLHLATLGTSLLMRSSQM